MIVFISSVITKQIENISYNFAEGITDGRAGEIENWINIYKSDLRVYSDAEINKMGDDNEVITWLQENTQLRNKDYDYMFFCDLEGTSFRDTGLVGSKGALTERDYYKAMVLDRKNEFVGEMVLSKTSGQYVVPIARPAVDEEDDIFGFYVDTR